MEKINEIKEKLKTGIVSFVYKKTNGDIREAKGTTNIDIIAENNATPNGNSNYTNSDYTTRYYDINSKGWRSFKNENLIEIL